MPGARGGPAALFADDMTSLDALLRQIGACRHCQDHLPLGANPVVRASASAALLIIGQAPGTRVHETSIPWNDASGQRLRDWLGLSPEVFYDESKVALMPMGFCYPGRLAAGGDAPPRPECAPLWHQALLDCMLELRMTLLVGQYAQRAYMPERKTWSLTQRVEAWQDSAPRLWPLPHPSWRSTAWLKKHPWFHETLLPALRAEIADLLP